LKGTWQRRKQKKERVKKKAEKPSRALGVGRNPAPNSCKLAKC
jgi:hypothetical protein